MRCVALYVVSRIVLVWYLCRAHRSLCLIAPWCTSVNGVSHQGEVIGLLSAMRVDVLTLRSMCELRFNRLDSKYATIVIMIVLLD